MKKHNINNFAARRRCLRKSRHNKTLNRQKQFFAMSKDNEPQTFISLKSA